MGILRAAGKLVEISDPVPVEVCPELCSDLADRSRSCGRCVALCPEQALQMGQGLDLGPGCTGCGICYSVCPNGVFFPTRRSDDEILSDRLGSARNHGVLSISCAAADVPGSAKVPCLSRCTETLLLRAVAAGARAVKLVRGTCEGCRFSRTMPHADSIISLAGALLQALGLGHVEIVVDVERAETLQDGEVQGGAKRRSSRRGFFSMVGAALATAAGSALPGPSAEEPQARPRNRRRAALLGAIAEVARVRGDSEPEPKEGESVTSGPEEGLFAEPTVAADRCDGCGVCGALCPVGALECEGTAGGFRILFSASLCTACGVCQRVCVKEALSLDPPRSLAPLLAGKAVPVVEIEKTPCRRCGAPLVLEPGSLCSTCRRRSEFRRHLP